MTTESAALSSLAAQLTLDAAATLDAFREEVRPGRTAAETYVFGLTEALARPDLRASLQDALLVAFAAAKGVGSGAMCECGWCRRRWTLKGGPRAAGRVRGAHRQAGGIDAGPPLWNVREREAEPPTPAVARGGAS